MAGITHGRLGTWKIFRNLKTMWCKAYDMVTITSKQDVTIWHACYRPLQMWIRYFFGNLIIVMMWGIRHGRYYLKKGCEHTAQLLSPLQNANLGFLWELDNCDDARHMTWLLLPQEGMWAYGTAAIAHYRMRAYGTTIITHYRMRAYGTAAITHC